MNDQDRLPQGGIKKAVSCDPSIIATWWLLTVGNVIYMSPIMTPHDGPDLSDRLPRLMAELVAEKGLWPFPGA